MKFWCLENDEQVLIHDGHELGLDLCVLLDGGKQIDFVIFVRGLYERFVA